MDIVQILYFVVLIGLYIYLSIKNHDKEIKHKKIAFMLFIIQGLSIIGNLIPEGIEVFSFPRNTISLTGYITHLISYYFLTEIGLLIIIFDIHESKKNIK